jgi:hypothetical protein
MAGPEEKTERIEALRGLVERLGAPDLTLAEAETLRAQLERLLGRSGREGKADRMASAPVVTPCTCDDGRCLAIWSPGPPIGTPV